MDTNQTQTLPEISVIVPVYNGEGYIVQCLETIKAQTFKNFEVIIVDNASVDNTAKICNQWIKDNTLLINYIYTDEKGVSKARNIGLKNAKGKYVAFIDADDYIANTYLEVLYKNITKNDGNISICGYIVTNKREKCESEKDCENKIFGKIIDFNDICKHVFRDSSIGGYVWNKLFDKKILDGIWFDDDIEMCEDMLFFFRVLKKNPKVIYQKTELYYYFMNLESASHKVEKAFDINKNFKYDKSMSMLKKENNFQTSVIRDINAGLFMYAVATKLNYSFCANKDSSIIKNLNGIFRKYWNDFLVTDLFSVKKKIKTILSLLLWRLKPFLRR